MRIKVFVACLLLAAFGLAQSADLSRWHEVRGGTWKVDRALWEEMKAQIQAAANPTQHGVEKVHTRDVSDFYVQLQGLSENGRSIVRLSGACSLLGDDAVESLDRAWYEVYDGGDCFFDALFDPASKRLVRFGFNGNA
jgi:hypothetical protein